MRVCANCPWPRRTVYLPRSGGGGGGGVGIQVQYYVPPISPTWRYLLTQVNAQGFRQYRTYNTSQDRMVLLFSRSRITSRMAKLGSRGLHSTSSEFSGGLAMSARGPSASSGHRGARHRWALATEHSGSGPASNRLEPPSDGLQSRHLPTISALWKGVRACRVGVGSGTRFDFIGIPASPRY